MNGLSSMTITIAFRLDDPHARSDHALEAKIFELFKRYSVPLCVAVVPCHRECASGERFYADSVAMPHVAEAIDDGSLHLAQHGFDHVSVSASGVESEFAGQPFEVQMQRIREGQQQLEQGFGQAIKGFVPPWNSHDFTTLAVLDKLGFEYISSGLSDPSGTRKSGIIGHLASVPRTTDFRRLEGALRAARYFIATAPVVVCVFHPDDFAEFVYPRLPGDSPPAINLSAVEAQLRRLRADSDIRITSIPEIAEEMHLGRTVVHMDDCRCAQFVPVRYAYRLPLSFLLKSPVRGLLLALGNGGNHDHGGSVGGSPASKNQA